MVDFSGVAAGDLDVRWIHGAATDPLIQVHRYDEHTYILRQSKTVHFEAPFLFLMLGNDRALLLDTGATEDAATFPLRETVDGILTDWLTAHPRDGYELIVAHTSPTRLRDLQRRGLSRYGRTGQFLSSVLSSLRAHNDDE